MELSLPSKVALITGGSRGIGAATVRLFAGAGAKVVFNYQSAKTQAQDLARECGAENCHVVQCDLSGTKPAQELVAAAVARFGRLDILVANHGIWPPEDAPIDRMSNEQWHRTVAVNLDSVFSLVKHAVAQMKKQGGSRPQSGKSGRSGDPGSAPQSGKSGRSEDPGSPAGHIVLVSSTAGQRGEAFHSDYAATKGALISMTKGLSTELARDRIYINCVAPGWVDTDMSAPALNHPPTREKVFRAIPLGRVGKPEEIAAPILFLCTSHAGFITGEVFNVNGGAVLVG